MNAPANGKAARRLETFKRLLAHLHEVASLDFGFRLWDGSTVPADLPSNALAIASPWIFPPDPGNPCPSAMS